MEKRPNLFFLSTREAVLWSKKTNKEGINFNLVETCSEYRDSIGTILVPKNSPYIDMINKRILWAHESGMLKQLESMWVGGLKLSTALKSPDTGRPISIGQIRVAVMMMVGFCFVALGLSVCEHLSKNLKNGVSTL